MIFGARAVIFGASAAIFASAMADWPPLPAPGTLYYDYLDSFGVGVKMDAWMEVDGTEIKGVEVEIWDTQSPRASSSAPPRCPPPGHLAAGRSRRRAALCVCVCARGEAWR